MAKDSRILTIEQAANELGFKEATVRQYISDGKIKAQRHGSKVRVSPSDNAELWKRRSEEMALAAA